MDSLGGGYDLLEDDKCFLTGVALWNFSEHISPMVMSRDWELTKS